MAFFDSYRVILTSKLTRISVHTLIILFAILVGYSGIASAVDDAYLQELEAEAKKTSNFKAHSPKSKASSKTSIKKNAKAAEIKQQVKKPSPVPIKSTQTNNTSKQDELKRFEQLLKFERPSTYHFYTRLDLKEKKLVLKDYNENKKISTASKLIFDLYFKH